ncbi:MULTISPECIES: glycoside hydrolase family 3 protein [unclassified Pseudoalteromonas]|uniref:glycoside hydrolase family 3 protein n=1 Tax=unclassified Pseudoalteromonas TaxID=194690 RepID=UPI001603EF69|nr:MULTISPECIES: glycoside hydrolase family 3 protein [unclassified Pseudoalteromonas]MBB1334627.1 glycoside hydrolase family 3 C-terminal domain-containing protein [Pseudoalteromonas sp. SR41-6]MBB1458432.1 glycoside hydrolase family 3 C-terminal domain-containing protein [Pseudoalteromonas sp. SG41-8]
MSKIKHPKLLLCLLPVFGMFNCQNVLSADNQQVNWPYVNTQLKRDPAVEKQIDKLLATMTLEQKVAQMIQPEIGYLSVEQMKKYGFGSYLNGGNTAPYGNKRADQATWLKYADEMYLASMDSTIDGIAIPTVWGTDAMHGHSNVYGATLFPHNIGLGAAHDVDLIKRIGQATAKEVSATGIEWSFAPTVAVVRDDRWGRTYESYSEDPELVRLYAGSMVTGIQGDIGADFLKGSNRIATAKHFVGDGGTERGVDRGNTLIDEKGLRDIHSAGYFSAINEGVQSVMASFNSWNGKRVHGDKHLLTDVLKNQLGFDGFVVSDWNAHKFVEGCDLEQCAQAINAGVDVIMVPEHFEAFYHNTVKQVKDGVIAESRINDAVRRFLRAKIRWNVFSKSKPSARPESQHPQWLGANEHRTLAREAVRKSLVLLKNNENVLPIKASSRILVAGKGANAINMQAGGWSVSWQGTDNTNSDFPNATSIYAGLQSQVTKAGGEITLSESGEYTSKPDVAIVVIGEEPYAEWFGDIEMLEFQHETKHALALLKQLKADNIPVVTIFLSGRPLWVNKELNASDAFVAAWLPGSEGEGVADVLLTNSEGKAQFDFSGKLSFSWPKYDDQFTLNLNDADYDPLFAYGYGLTYQDNINVPVLSEKTSPKKIVNSDSHPLFVRNLAKNMTWQLADTSTEKVLASGASATSGDKQSLLMQSVNLSYQEDGRGFNWRAQAAVSLSFLKPEQLDSKFSAGYLELKMRIDKAPEQGANLQVMCSENHCLRNIDFSSFSQLMTDKSWHTLAIPLHCGDSGLAEQKITDALRITSQNLSLAIADVVLTIKPSNDSLSLTCAK